MSHVEGFLPEDYVPEVNQRLALYKRLAGAAGDAEVADLRAELADRFGPLARRRPSSCSTSSASASPRARSASSASRPATGKALITFSPVDARSSPDGSSRAIQRQPRPAPDEARVHAGGGDRARRVAARARLAARPARRAGPRVSRRLVRRALLAARLPSAGCAVPQLDAAASARKPRRGAGAAEAAAAPTLDRAEPGWRAGGRDAGRRERDRPRLAVVNNDAITLGELQEAIAVYRHENRERGAGASDERARASSSSPG